MAFIAAGGAFRFPGPWYDDSRANIARIRLLSDKELDNTAAILEPYMREWLHTQALDDGPITRVVLKPNADSRKGIRVSKSAFVMGEVARDEQRIRRQWTTLRAAWIAATIRAPRASQAVRVS